MESEQDPSEGHDDTRATEPPADDATEQESGGPQGNPEVDEEALQHRQQEGSRERQD